MMIALACAACGAAQGTNDGRLLAVNTSAQASTVTAVSAEGSEVSASPTPIAMVDGQPLFKKDLKGTSGARLMRIRQQEFDAESEALDSLIREKVVEIEAKKQGLTVEQLYKKEVDAKIAEPSEAEVRGYYYAIKSRTTLPLSKLEPQIKKLIMDSEIRDGRDAYADSLQAKAEIRILLKAPSVQTGPNDSGRIEGDPNAPITILEFGDYECPFCGRAEPTVEAVMKKYKGKVKLAFRDYPLSAIHPFADEAAEASRCAEAQHKFWPMHDAMYADQSKLSEDDLIKTAARLGMNKETFSACLKAKPYKESIQRDLEAGQKAGVDGTPAFFINGRFVNGAVPESKFDEVINSELAGLKEQNSTVAKR